MLAFRLLLVVFIFLGGGLCASATPLKWGFLGSGFHMQFFIEHNTSSTEEFYTFELPNSFIIDTAEAESRYSIVSSTENMDVTSDYLPLSLKTTFMCDIEAPVFTVTRNNTVSINLTKKSQTSADTATELRRLIFPIHARYEVLSQEAPPNFFSFFGERDAYVTRCISEVKTAFNSSVLEEFQSNQEYHCRNIPVPYLSDLPFVYSSLVISLLVGSAIAIFSLSF